MYGATIGKLSIWGIDASTNQACAVAIPNNEILDREYLYYFLLAQRRNFIEAGKGGAQPNISQGILKQWPIWLAPLNEQRRIVAKIEALFSELDKGIESLKTAQAQLKVYRQAVLKHAFEGKLTADWRAQREAHLESAEAVKAEILERRRTEWEAAQYAKFEASGKLPRNEKWKKSYKQPFKIKDDTLPDLPSNWCWISLDELTSGKPRSLQSGPFGSNLRHSEFKDEGILVVGIDNVLDGDFSMGSQHRISIDKYRELERYTARPGDLLVTVMASLGRTCVIPRELETAIITKHVYRVSTEEDFVYPEFFNLVLQSETVSRRRMFQNAQGQTRPGLNSSILKELPLPLCSPEEQKEIVYRLDAHLSYIDELDDVLSNEVARNRALRQSILKKAFAGELVPQDPRDEPASALLERIRAEKAQSKKIRKPRTSSKKRAA